MSSAGHILDMINRIKQNKRSKRREFKGDNRENIYSEKFDVVTAYDFPTVSDVELEKIRRFIKEKAKQDKRKSYYLLVISIILASMAIWAFLRYFKVNFDGFY